MVVVGKALAVSLSTEFPTENQYKHRQRRHRDTGPTLNSGVQHNSLMDGWRNGLYMVAAEKIIVFQQIPEDPENRCRRWQIYNLLAMQMSSTFCSFCVHRIVVVASCLLGNSTAVDGLWSTFYSGPTAVEVQK